MPTDQELAAALLATQQQQQQQQQQQPQQQYQPPQQMYAPPANVLPNYLATLADAGNAYRLAEAEKDKKIKELEAKLAASTKVDPAKITNRDVADHVARLEAMVKESQVQAEDKRRRKELSAYVAAIKSGIPPSEAIHDMIGGSTLQEVEASVSRAIAAAQQYKRQMAELQFQQPPPMQQQQQYPQGYQPQGYQPQYQQAPPYNPYQAQHSQMQQQQGYQQLAPVQGPTYMPPNVGFNPAGLDPVSSFVQAASNLSDPRHGGYGGQTREAMLNAIKQMTGGNRDGVMSSGPTPPGGFNISNTGMSNQNANPALQQTAMSPQFQQQQQPQDAFAGYPGYTRR